jgi:hypothetical protein
LDGIIAKDDIPKALVQEISGTITAYELPRNDRGVVYSIEKLNEV